MKLYYSPTNKRQQLKNKRKAFNMSPTNKPNKGTAVPPTGTAVPPAGTAVPPTGTALAVQRCAGAGSVGGGER